MLQRANGTIAAGVNSAMRGVQRCVIVHMIGDRRRAGVTNSRRSEYGEIEQE